VRPALEWYLTQVVSCWRSASAIGVEDENDPREEAFEAGPTAALGAGFSSSVPETDRSDVRGPRKGGLR